MFRIKAHCLKKTVFVKVVHIFYRPSNETIETMYLTPTPLPRKTQLKASRTYEYDSAPHPYASCRMCSVQKWGDVEESMVG